MNTSNEPDKINAEEKQLICVRPFDWYEIAWNKKVYPCCSGWVSQSLGDALEQTPQEIWFGENAKKVRQSVHDGSFKYCNKNFCPFIADAVDPVFWVSKSEVEHYQRMIDDPEQYLTLPKVLNCGYDSSCNLACPSCRSKVVMADKKERQLYDLLFDQMLEQFGPHLESINMAGSGDPFASRHFWDKLQSGVIADYPNIKLRLHTNAQLLDEYHWNRIAKIHHQIAEIEISIDAATGDTYRLNRTPGDWDLLLTNMKFIADLKKQNKIKELQVDFVVQKNNWQEMEEFIHLGRLWNVDRIFFSALKNWTTFSDQDYAERSIHLSSHPEHAKLIEMLRRPLFSEPGVFIGFSDVLGCLHKP